LNACNSDKLRGNEVACKKRDDCNWDNHNAECVTSAAAPPPAPAAPAPAAPAAPAPAAQQWNGSPTNPTLFHTRMMKTFAIFRRYEHLFTRTGDIALEPPNEVQLANRGITEVPNPHAPDVPVVVFIRAKHDPYEVFGHGTGCHAEQELLYAMHPKAEVRFLTADRVAGTSPDFNALSLYEILDDIKKEKRRIVHLVVLAHGTPHSMKFGDDQKNGSVCTRWPAENDGNLDGNLDGFAQKLSPLLAPNATIMLNSCNTGKDDESRPSIAEALARRLPGVAVSAPNGASKNNEISLVGVPTEIDNEQLLYNTGSSTVTGEYMYDVEASIHVLPYEIKRFLTHEGLHGGVLDHVVQNPPDENVDFLWL